MALYQRITRHLLRYMNANTYKNSDEVYLTYYDNSLTNGDVNTLKGDWLTDSVIAFWEEYLEHEVLAQYNTRIILLRPSMSFLLLHTVDPQTLKSALPDFTRASHVFLPINDCRDTTEAEGGSHWSLLLVSLVDKVAFHYDSLPPGNVTEASQVTAKISKLCDIPIKFVHMRDSPMQENSSDCGIFVCMTMRYLLQHRLLQAHSKEYVTMALDGVPLDASTARKEMLHIIHRLKRDRDRRRSYVTSSAAPVASRSFATPRSLLARTHNAAVHPSPLDPRAPATPASPCRGSRFPLLTYFFACVLFIVMIGVAIALYFPNFNLIYVYHSYTQVYHPMYRESCQRLDSLLVSANSMLSPFLAQAYSQLQELHGHGKEYFTKVYDAFAHLRRI
ncbi:putative Ulp1 peptidase [Microsporum audouinii]